MTCVCSFRVFGMYLRINKNLLILYFTLKTNWYSHTCMISFCRESLSTQPWSHFLTGITSTTVNNTTTLKDKVNKWKRRLDIRFDKLLEKRGRAYLFPRPQMDSLIGWRMANQNSLGAYMGVINYFQNCHPYWTIHTTHFSLLLRTQSV